MCVVLSLLRESDENVTSEQKDVSAGHILRLVVLEFDVDAVLNPDFHRDLLVAFGLFLVLDDPQLSRVDNRRKVIPRYGYAQEVSKMNRRAIVRFIWLVCLWEAEGNREWSGKASRRR